MPGHCIHPAGWTAVLEVCALLTPMHASALHGHPEWPVPVQHMHVRV